ncbi:disease resistance protein TAO1-like [Syzygium oleosum]|uniref:disease resistance protein TAO1-like n=1 Tax=Syzygium oleosum TaxID=219896 RepID=UPI0024BBBB75|nr:disease resistance protein TAO1-like [Syzygium oleosum]
MNNFKTSRWFHNFLREASIGNSNELLSEVRWLWWRVEGSDLSLPTTSLHLPNLSVLELSGSWNFTEDWEGRRSSFMTPKRLLVLDLTWCWGLRRTPDLSAFTQLKILTLRHCEGLEHLHPSIGKLKSLVSLDLSLCGSLKELPEEVGGLKDVLDKSGITEIPTSIGSLRKLKKLSAYRCKSLREIPSSIGDLQNLQFLDVSYSRLEKLPNAIGDLSSLQRLELRRCHKLRSLPRLSSLIHLEKLRLLECYLLEDIPELPSRLLKLSVWECHKLILLKLDGLKNLETFSIKGCSSIERLDLSQLIRLKRLCAEHCYNLVEIQGLENLELLEGISINYCDSIERLLCPKSGCLKKLVAAWCKNLVEIRGLDGAKFLEALTVMGWVSMETLPDLNGCEKLRSLNLRNWRKLTQLRGLEKLDLIDLDISGCDSLEAIPKLSGTCVFRNYERKLSYDSWSDDSSTESD